MLQEPASTARWYVVQQTGMVYVFDNQPDVIDAARVHQSGDRRSPAQVPATNGPARHGLSSRTTPPNPRVYLSYTASDWRAAGVAHRRIPDAGWRPDARRRHAQVILQVNQPEANHNGGNIAFGPDGFLYIGFGDGGGGGDAHGAIGNGQRLSTLLGKMLRIDVNGTTGATRYTIPAGNPYAGNAVCNNDTGALQNCPEIYAYGFRNPWRWSFDRGSGELWVGDVGQDAWEEVDRVVAGGNYGWRCREGDACLQRQLRHRIRRGAFARCGIRPHATAFSITGGFVYRGSAIPALRAATCSATSAPGRIWHIARDTAPTLQVTSGVVQRPEHRLVRPGSPMANSMWWISAARCTGCVPAARRRRAIPTQLSATGCVNAGRSHAAGRRADSLRAQRAVLVRWRGEVALAGVARRPEDHGGWRRRFRFPERHRAGEELPARLAAGGDAAVHAPRRWRVGGLHLRVECRRAPTPRAWSAARPCRSPGRPGCSRAKRSACCATPRRPGKTLGLEIAQLNGQLPYAATGRTANQLATLDAIGCSRPR